MTITAKDLVISLEKYGIKSTIDNGKIHFQRTVPTRWFKPEENLKYSCTFGGWTRAIGAKTVRDVLTALKLYDQFADYQSFIDGQEPYYSLINEFEMPLRRLEDK